MVIHLLIHTHPMRLVPGYRLLSPLEVLHNIFGEILLDYFEIYLRFVAELFEGIDIDSLILDVAGVGAKGEAADGFVEEGGFYNVDFC